MGGRGAQPPYPPQEKSLRTSPYPKGRGPSLRRNFDTQAPNLACGPLGAWGPQNHPPSMDTPASHPARKTPSGDFGRLPRGHLGLNLGPDPMAGPPTLQGAHHHLSSPIWPLGHQVMATSSCCLAKSGQNWGCCPAGAVVGWRVWGSGDPMGTMGCHVGGHHGGAPMGARGWAAGLSGRLAAWQQGPSSLPDRPGFGLPFHSQGPRCPRTPSHPSPPTETMAIQPGANTGQGKFEAWCSSCQGTDWCAWCGGLTRAIMGSKGMHRGGTSTMEPHVKGHLKKWPEVSLKALSPKVQFRVCLYKAVEASD